MPPSSPAESASLALQSLEALRLHAIELARHHEADIQPIPESHRTSARNLLHYLSLRRHDIRDLQRQLKLLGLSRLASAEAHTLASLDAVGRALRALAGVAPTPETANLAIADGEALLHRHADELLGPSQADHATRIMVTLPPEAASQPLLLRQLVEAGLDIIRINCAHDGPDAWLAMIANLRAAERATGRKCQVYADLAGPKLRTGAIAPIGRMVEFRPQRDSWGRVTAPARIWLTPRSRVEAPAIDVDATLPVDDGLIRAANARDIVDVEDSRGSQRHLRLKERFGDSWLALSFQRGYIPDGSPCQLYREDQPITQGTVGPLPEVCQPIQLRIGDQLLVTGEDGPGRPARHDEAGRLIEPARIPCTLDAVFASARPGQAVWFDDGRIGGRILANRDRVITVEISHASPQGSKLRAEKGINLPDTDLAIPALTEQDKAHLAILAPHVDMVGLSFVRHPDDLADLQRELGRLDARHIGSVVKVETRQAFEHLPEILLTGLRHPPLGVMVARGDLAVEVGFERLSEVQEEMLMLCEAAHVPVIWATQVLETMAKRGIPSRAEVSDAALSARAECVMLNKGPYIVETTEFLSGILARMDSHRSKRSPTMRRLAVSDLPA
ncbi:MAG: pyruvate kinase [Thiobacillus sp.]|nr:pyruvate kinase [Thiobacillus sp.]